MIEAIRDIILPPVCPICGKVNSGFLCSSCRAQIRELGNVCGYCGTPLDGKKCIFCRDKRFYFYKLRSYTAYRGPIKKIIYKYKRQKIYSLREVLAGFLEELFYKNFSGENIDLIEGIPGPHISHICRELATRLNIPYANNLKKIKVTRQQKELGFVTRAFNLDGSFKLRDCLKVAGLNIVLIDDIFTTGNTVNEASKVLKGAGANKVYVLTIARGFKSI